jgi:hypothetical protein
MHSQARVDLRRDREIVLSRAVMVSVLHRVANVLLSRVVNARRNRVDSVRLRETSVLRKTIVHRSRVGRRKITARHKEGRLKVVLRRIIVLRRGGLTSTLIRGIATSLRSTIVRMPCAGAIVGVRRLYRDM